jgi:hypothetical protein
MESFIRVDPPYRLLLRLYMSAHVYHVKIDNLLTALLMPD